MTILDRIRKARELVAAMDAARVAYNNERDWPSAGGAKQVTANQLAQAMGEAKEAAIALIRDPDLLALGEDVAFLRVTLGAENDRLQRAEAAEAKLAAAEVDAQRYRWLRENLPAGTFGGFDVFNAKSWDAAIDAMKGEGDK